MSMAVFLVSIFPSFASAEIHWKQDTFEDGRDLKENFGMEILIALFSN